MNNDEKLTHSSFTKGAITKKSSRSTGGSAVGFGKHDVELF